MAEKLTKGAQLLFRDINVICSTEGCFWITNGKLASIYDVSERTIRRWLKELIDQNLISWVYDKYMRRCIRIEAGMLSH